MKFLCSNCKAKYQIADEKVAGRTLRMTCRQCKQEIVIRGDAPARASITAAHAQQSQPIAPVPAPISAPSPLSADFQRQLGGGMRPSMPAPQPLLDAWHVAINEVPVGPMRREDVARRIASGAVHAESLAWREGLDDWLPLRQIPELAALLGASMPAPAPFVPALPAQRADLAPMGGRAGAAPAFSLDEWSAQAPTAPMQQALLSIPAAAPVREAERDRGGFRMSGGMLFAIIAGTFLMAMVAILGAKSLLKEDTVAAAPTPAVTIVNQQPAAQVQQPAQPEAQPSEMVIDLDEVGVAGETTGTKPKTGTKPSTTTTTKPTSTKPKLTQAELDMLARMGGGTPTPGITDIDRGSNSGSGRNSNVASGEGLTGEQLSKVVMNGRKNLQRCYETALRGSGSDETIRLDVELTVSPSGNVTNVKSGDGGLPGLKECVTRTVKMWRFPNAGDSTTTKFPLVFQPGA